MFENLVIKQPRSMVVVKRTFQLIVVRTDRRLSRVVSGKEPHAPVSDSILRPGSTIETNLCSYARTPIEVRLELVQGAPAETFALQHLPGNDWAFLDPLPRQVAQTNVLTADFLNHFEKGRALVRATAPRLSAVRPNTAAGCARSGTGDSVVDVSDQFFQAFVRDPFLH
jgi:hypothetical protein